MSRRDAGAPRKSDGATQRQNLRPIGKFGHGAAPAAAGPGVFPYFLTALEIFAAYQDSDFVSMTFVNLARLWQESGDAILPEAVGRLSSTPPEEIEESFRELLAGGT